MVRVGDSLYRDNPSNRREMTLHGGELVLGNTPLVYLGTVPDGAGDPDVDEVLRLVWLQGIDRPMTISFYALDLCRPISRMSDAHDGQEVPR